MCHCNSFRQRIISCSTRVCVYSGEEYDSSAVAFLLAIANDNTNPQLYMNLALVYKKLDTTSIVTQAYNNVIRVLHPELIAYPYNDLATFYLQKTMWRNAIAAYQRTLDGNPDLNDSYYFIGMSYMNLSEHQIATIMYGHSCPK